MKVYLYCLSALLLLTSFNCIHPIDCSGLKNGKFYYFTKPDRTLVNVERNDSLQLETEMKSGAILKSKIIWTSDCHFQMFVGAFNKDKHTLLDTLMATTPVEIEIISIRKDFYICTGVLEMRNRKAEIRDTLYFKK